MVRLNSAPNSIDAAYAIIAKRYGLTFNAFMTVCMIDEAENVTKKQLCDVLHLPKSTVHSLLLALIKQEYVTLVAGNNKKEKFIAFTKGGRLHFTKILEGTQLFEERVLSALSDKTCAIL